MRCARRTSFLAEIGEMLRINIVEGLDHAMADLARDPGTFSEAVLNLGDAAVALARIIIARVDDRNCRGHRGEKTVRKLADFFHRDRQNDEIDPADSVFNCNRCSARFCCDVCERCRATRIGYDDAMTEFGETARQRAANMSCADDADPHRLSPPVFIVHIIAARHSNGRGAFHNLAVQTAAAA